MWCDSKYIAFDFETSGTLPEYALQPWRVAQGKAWVTSLATVRKAPNDLIIGGGLFVGDDPIDIHDTIKTFLTYAIEHGLTVVGWNVAFDISWLLAYGFEYEVSQLKFLDGMLLWKHLTVEPEYDLVRAHKKSYGLKLAVAEFLPKFAGYEEDVDFHSTEPESLAKLQKYNVRDTMFTLRLTKMFYDELAKDPQRLKAALIEADCLPLVAQANLDGMLVDQEAATTLGHTLVQTADDMLARLESHGVTEKVVRSPVQLSKLMFEDWGLPVLKVNVSDKTGKTTNSTDKEVLHELSFLDPRAAEIRLYREALGNKTKFVDAPLKSVEYNEDLRTHPLAMVFSTYTGRMTYASKQGRNKDERQIGFALHQEKRGKDFRAIITAPPGYTLMEFDAAGQEFRWMAIASGDETMLELCLPGEDPHGFMGARIRHMDYRELLQKVYAGDKDAKDGRQMGKVANLSLQFRTSAKKLRVVARVQYNLPMGLPEAENIHRTYQQTYIKVPVYWKNQIALTKRLGYVETFAGRRVQVAGNWGGTKGWSMESTSINYRIQGCLQYDSRVLTTEGLVRIGDLAVRSKDQPVSVWTGFTWASAVAVNRGTCQLAEVTLTTGEVIKCDTRHKLKNDQREWVEFKDMHKDMWVALPRTTGACAPTADVTWAYILGLYLGDGWLSVRPRDGNSIRHEFGLCGGVTKLHNLRRVQKFLAAHGYTTTLRKTKPTVWALTGGSTSLAERIRQLGVVPNLTSRTKRLTEAMWRLPPQERADLWQGMCDSDGSTVAGQQGNIHSPNLMLIQDLQTLISAIGIDSHISATNNGYLLRVLRSKGYRPYPKHVLLRDLAGRVPTCRMGDCESIVDRRAVVGGQGVTQRVAERIYARWIPEISEVYRYAQIRSIRVLPIEDDTYTLAVDDPLHQFVADGVIHKNTGGDQKYLALSVLKPYITRIGARFAWELHDGLYLYVPNHMVARAAVEIPYLLGNLPYKKAWGFTPPIPLPWDVKHGSNWGNLVEWGCK